MALHKDFPSDPHAVLDPAIRWFPADEVLRENMGKLLPPLVAFSYGSPILHSYSVVHL